MRILIDYNLEGDAPLLLATLLQDGWVELLELEFVFFRETPLLPDSEDDLIWRYSQAQGMLLLTNNRNKKDATSLEATIERENQTVSLPVLTIASPLRLKESGYRSRVAARLAEIVTYLEDNLGTGRLFIP